MIRTPKTGKWDFDLENTLQFGRRRASTSPSDTRDLDVFAHFHHAEVGYTFRSAWTPRVSGELDFASGDRDPGDGDFGRFDSLFGPRRADFGPTGIFGILGRENIISSGVRLSVNPGAHTDGFVSWRANFLDEPTDSFARSGVRDVSGRSGTFAGHQIEGRVRHWLVPGLLRLEIGTAWFPEGEFLRNAPSAAGHGDPFFVYSDLEFTF